MGRGSTISESGRSTVYVKSIALRKVAIIKKLKEDYADFNEHSERESLLWKTFVWSVALYGSEMWTMGKWKRDKEQTEALGHGCRRTQGMSWRNQVSNAEIFKLIIERQRSKRSPGGNINCWST